MSLRNWAKNTLLMSALAVFAPLGGCDESGEQKGVKIHGMSPDEWDEMNRHYARAQREALPDFDSDPFANLAGGWIIEKEQFLGTMLVFGVADGERIADYSDGPDGWRLKVTGIRCSADRVCTINFDDGQIMILRYESYDAIRIINSHSKLGGAPYKGQTLKRNVY